MDTYGNFIDNYAAYTTNSGMEVVIGRHPALGAFGDLTGKTVLDFGCGPGTNGLDLSRQGAQQVIGIDVSSEELERARRVDPTGLYLYYDGLNLADAVSGSVVMVDAILASFSICTIPDTALGSLLGDMRRLLSEGGELLIIEPNFQRSLGIHYPGELHYHEQPGVQSGDYVHVTLGEGEQAVELFHDIYRTHDDYRRLLAAAGFTVQIFDEMRPPASCEQKWAELAKEYPPFLLITAH
jgi:SAM-dependent methyltransferase